MEVEVEEDLEVEVEEALEVEVEEVLGAEEEETGVEEEDFEEVEVVVEDSGPLEMKGASVDEGVSVALLEAVEVDEEGSEGAKG